MLALFSRKQVSSEKPVHELQDEELMACYAKGDVAAFEELLRRHEKPVFNFIARYLGDRVAAEDLVQEVFVRVIRTADRYKKKAKFTTWLFTIARNICIDKARYQSRRNEVSLNRSVTADDENTGTSFIDQLQEESGESSEGSLIRTEFRAKLQSALLELPDEQREVFVMREFGGMKFREIATVIGVSENTIKSRMRYALQSLRGHLADYRDHSFDRESERERTSN